MVALDCLVGSFHVVGDRVYRVVGYEVLDALPSCPPTGTPVIVLRLELVR